MALQRLEVPATWAKALEEFEIELLGAGRSMNTVDLRHRHVVALARELDVAPNLVTRRDILRFVRTRDWSAETMRSMYSSWRTFFEFCQREGFIDRAPDLPTVKRSTPSPRPANDVAVKAALTSTDPRVVLAAHMVKGAGLRREECVKVHPRRDLFQDLIGWTLRVHGKGGKIRYVPISEDLAERLLALPDGYAFPGQIDGHLSPAYLGKLMSRALPDGVTMHALRHRYATVAYQRTNDLVSVQQLLGHASPDTTIRYIQVPDDKLRKVAATAWVA